MTPNFSGIDEGLAVMVDITDSMFDGIRAELMRCLKNGKFRDSLYKFLHLPPVTQNVPLHYCRTHGRLENGMRRFWAANELARPALPVEVWDCCLSEVDARRKAKAVRTAWKAQPKMEKKAQGEPDGQGMGKPTESEPRRP